MNKYIKLEDAIRVVADQYMFEATMDSPYESEDIEDYIEIGELLLGDLPTIEVSEDAISSVVADRPKGEWIGTESDGYADGHPVYSEWECSICGCEVEDETNYCPNCGAQMTEPKGEEQ